MRTACCLVAAFWSAPLSAQELRLPPLLSDHAVVQRGAPLRVFGWATPQADVRAAASWGHEASSRADERGFFELRLQPSDKAGPHELTLTSGTVTRAVRDLWFGEVWVCGGQSNMEWTLGPGVGAGIADWKAEVAAADFPAIRMFDVASVTAATPRESCEGQWQVCSPATAGRFSAVGYLFGRELHRALGVPIGLISSNWGGTVVEAWMPEARLQAFGEFTSGLAAVRAARQTTEQDTLAARQAAFVENLRKVDGLEVEASAASSDDAGWAEAKVPGIWEGELADFDGVVWYRRGVEIPAGWAGRALTLSLGAIDDLDTVWLDGARVGGMEAGEPWNVPRRYTVPAASVTAGKKTLAVRVVDTGGGGGFIGSPDELWLAPEGQTERVSLAGTWRQRRGAAMAKFGAWPRQAGLGPNTPSALWNGMIAPLLRHKVRGAIFYQGESNIGRAVQYRTLFPAMIETWREGFGDAALPFYYVQIAPYRYGGRDAQLAAFLREAQTMAMSALPNTGMAVTMDIGDPRDIHPANKQDVGKRLAMWALAKTYGVSDIDPCGPLLATTTVEGDALRLTLSHARGLRTRDGAEPSHFTIAGTDRVFHPAQARIEGETIVVRSAAVASPVAVRYAFGTADMPNLVNGVGLPAPSFRSDDWAPPQ
jgi:sialate O-acetylesterase